MVDSKDPSGIHNVTGAMPGEVLLKVQKPLAANHDTGNRVLIYNWDNTIYQEIDLNPLQMKVLFPEGVYKIFVVGSVIKRVIDGKDLVEFSVRGIVSEDEWPEW